jgi:hypothetical protein
MHWSLRGAEWALEVNFQLCSLVFHFFSPKISVPEPQQTHLSETWILFFWTRPEKEKLLRQNLPFLAFFRRFLPFLAFYSRGLSPN